MDPRENVPDENYQSCNFNSLTAVTISKGGTMAYTDKDLPYAIIQLCPWYLKEVSCFSLPVSVDNHRQLLIMM